MILPMVRNNKDFQSEKIIFLENRKRDIKDKAMIITENIVIIILGLCRKIIPDTEIITTVMIIGLTFFSRIGLKEALSIIINENMITTRQQIVISGNIKAPK